MIVLCIDVVAKIDFADSRCAEVCSGLRFQLVLQYSGRNTDECSSGDVVEDKMRWPSIDSRKLTLM